MIDFVEQVTEEICIYFNDDLVAKIIKDDGKYKLELLHGFECEDLDGDDYIEIGNKLNELNGGE